MQPLREIKSTVEYVKIPETAHDASSGVRSTVEEILQSVLDEGDAALRRFSKKLDQVDLEVFEVTQEQAETAISSLDPMTKSDSEFAIDNITRFANAQLQTLQPLEYESLPGLHLGHRNIPIERVGCYVPGGRYPIFSAPIMSIVPAKVAGCSSVIACLPPNAHESMVALCSLSGADRIFRLGGAQAIAAMAYGSDSIPAVDKIVGPGNSFVNEAKRQVFGTVGIDALAGPSEIFVVADDTADARIVAADILGQAEHDPAARAGVVTTSSTLALEVQRQVELQLETLSTREVAGRAWRDHGSIAVVENAEGLVEYANAVAAEHLEIHASNPHELSNSITNYGSQFIGENASVVYSDKCAGTNHTLPTLGAARYTGGLWVGTYLKTCTHQWLDQHAVPTVAKPAIRQSLAEGMEAHARAAAARLPENEANAMLGENTKN